MPEVATNVLSYGDNLDILRRYLPDAAVDLVYLDPPFHSNRDYNVIFKDESGKQSDASLRAFEDTWHWGPSAEASPTCWRSRRRCIISVVLPIAHSPRRAVCCG